MAEPSIKVEQSTEGYSDVNELEVGATLASFLTNLMADLENLGDNFTVSMIGEALGVNPTSDILDASGAPNYLFNPESGEELESDSTESVGSGSNSSSSESESSISGGGNPDTKVLSRSSFSFSLESITKDFDL